MGVDTRTHNSAWASCLGVYITFSCMRLMATRLAQAAAASIDASVCGPTQWAQLAVCALLSWALARPSRAAHAATSLAFRALASLMVRPFFKPVAWGQAPSDWTPWLQRGAARGPGSNTSSLAGSEASSTWSGKDVASFRIPDRKLKSRARGGTLAPPPPPPHLRGHPRRQAVGPWTRSQQTGGYHTNPSTPRALTRGESVPACPTSPLSPKSPLTFTLGGPRARHTFRSTRPSLTLNDPVESAHSGGPTTSLDRSSGGAQGPTMSQHPSPFEAASGLTQQPSVYLEQSNDLEALSWSSQASASLGHLTAKGAALLRPLVPPTPSLSLDRLKRWPSGPAAPWPFGRGNLSAASDEEEEEEEGEAAVSRRASMDGGAPPTHSSRHYTRGDIVAGSPARHAAFERCAAGARMDCAAAAASGRALPGRVAAADGRGASALASLGLDGDCPPAIRAMVPDEHLLQLGALMDEGPTVEAMAALGVPPACSERGALCDAADDFSRATWEPVASESRSGLRLAAWRLPLRKGLYAYKTVVTIDGVSPADVRPFHLDDAARALWDDGALEVRRPVPPGCARASRHAESCMHSYLSKFPGPMAPRRYTYARRVWHRPADGGCYVLCTGCELPEGGLGGSKNDSPRRREVEVLEFCSGAVVRAAPGGGGVQVATLYYEDSQVRPGLAKVGVPKGLWPFWSKYEAALRVFAGARASGAAAVLHRGGGGDAGSDGEGSDDDVYGALAELKAARRASERRRGGALGASSRWARRIIVAGAIKMMHVILVAD